MNGIHSTLARSIKIFARMVKQWWNLHPININGQKSLIQLKLTFSQVHVEKCVASKDYILQLKPTISEMGKLLKCKPCHNSNHLHYREEQYPD